MSTFVIYEKVVDAKKAKVIKTEKFDKTKYKPVPLNTVEMQKLISKKLKISSHEAMAIAEKLYNRGFISYPRTETQIFSPNENLKKLVEEQKKSPEWGAFATGLLDDNRYAAPRNGKLNDKAHPPIHPVKCPKPDELNYKEKKIYELLARHFLACVSTDAKGQENVLELEMGGEVFKARGLKITDKGFLEVYPYDYWPESKLPIMTMGDYIEPKSLLLKEGSTSPPSYLTEAELIGLMDKNGIGTDATIHEHIKKVQDRGYASFEKNCFKPTLKGTSMLKGYEQLGIELYKPALRRNMERMITDVAEGRKAERQAYAQMKEDMKKLFEKVFSKQNEYRQNVSTFLDVNINYERELQGIAGVDENVMGDNRRPKKENNYKEQKQDNKGSSSKGGGLIVGKCTGCGGVLKVINFKNSYFIGCSGYPKCKSSKSIDGKPTKVEDSGNKCEACGNILFIVTKENGSEIEYCLNCYIQGKCSKVFAPDRNESQSRSQRDVYLTKEEQDILDGIDDFLI